MLIHLGINNKVIKRYWRDVIIGYVGKGRSVWRWNCIGRESKCMSWSRRRRDGVEVESN
jgi:hypothetical protein